MHRVALVLPETDDGRIAFIVPWQGVVVLGTTDTEWAPGEDDPEITRDDVEYLLDHASRFLAAPIDRRDVIGAYAGLRPLISAGSGSSARLSRRHGVVQSTAGFYSVIGGKLTTYRRMAEDVVNAATGRRMGTPSPTRTLCLSGAEGLGEALPALRERARRLGLSRSTLLHLVRNHGTQAAAVLALVEERPVLGTPMAGGFPHIGAEVVVAVREEMAATLADVLLRRTRLAHLLPDQGIGIAPRVAELMAEELGWAALARAAQVAEYERAAARFRVPSSGAPALSATSGAPRGSEGGDLP